MSVLIKGIEMPKYPTAIRIQIEADGTVYRHIADTNCRGWELLKNVTAIEVPPHGRLIDADKMCADLATVDPVYETMIDWCIRVTEAQPTIIEADGKDINVPIKEDGA